MSLFLADMVHEALDFRFLTIPVPKILCFNMFGLLNWWLKIIVVTNLRVLQNHNFCATNANMQIVK